MYTKRPFALIFRHHVLKRYPLCLQAIFLDSSSSISGFEEDQDGQYVGGDCHNGTHGIRFSSGTGQHFGLCITIRGWRLPQGSSLFRDGHRVIFLGDYSAVNGVVLI